MWQEGAGSLLLLAAAHETGLIETLDAALPLASSTCPARLARSTHASRERLLLTLLFLNAVGLRRTIDLRSYTGAGLAVLSRRQRAYGYRHVERFLAQVAQARGDESLTDALARWTAQLWLLEKLKPGHSPPAFYVDGHKKPVYTDHLIPRGLVGRTGKILGCRALLLLHDTKGHPLFATTHRGDLHLTKGVSTFLDRYDQATGAPPVARLIIDREGMAAEFLFTLVKAERTVVTILQPEQYEGLASFSEVGTFVPLCRDRAGNVTREVAPARFALKLPDHPGEILPLSVALIRDLRRQVPTPCSPEEEASPARWDADLDRTQGHWWEPGWVASPAPAVLTEPKLIPIVTTAPDLDVVELAQTYTHRWPAQENSIRDYLLALGLDTNHGYAQQRAENSEVSKRRTDLEQRLANLQRWAEGARVRGRQATRLYVRRCRETKERAKALYRTLNDHQWELERQEVDDRTLRTTIKEEQRVADAEIAEYEQRQWRAYDQSNAEYDKCERYCRKQRDLLRQLEDLAASERTMYELEHTKDQVMTALKLALVNLVMWTRDRYFPATYAQATWHRLAPFFRLPGRIVWGTDKVSVELRPFNDRRLTRDLVELCQRVNATQPRLPDGRSVVLWIPSSFRSPVSTQPYQAALHAACTSRRAVLE